MTGNHQFLIGGDHPCGYFAVASGDAWARRFVGLRIEADVLGQQLTRNVIAEPVPENVREQYKKLMACAKRLEDAGVVVKPLLVLGDRVRTVMREAKCPVLIIPSKALKED